jgi:hypothetical protein
MLRILRRICRKICRPFSSNDRRGETDAFGSKKTSLPHPRGRVTTLARPVGSALSPPTLRARRWRRHRSRRSKTLYRSASPCRGRVRKNASQGGRNGIKLQALTGNGHEGIFCVAPSSSRTGRESRNTLRKHLEVNSCQIFLIPLEKKHFLRHVRLQQILQRGNVLCRVQRVGGTKGRGG